MGMLGLVPLAYRILFGFAAMILMLAAVYFSGHRAGAAEVQRRWDQAARVAVQQARDTEQGWQHKYQGAIDDRTKVENELARHRAISVAADERLRRAAGDFQRRLSQAPAETCRTAAGAAAELLGQCSGEYRSLAERADGHVADLRQCEYAWPG